MWKKWNKEKKNKIEWAIADDNDVIDDNIHDTYVE